MKKVLLLFILILNLNAEDFRDPTHDVWKAKSVESAIKALYGDIKFDVDKKFKIKGSKYVSIMQASSSPKSYRDFRNYGLHILSDIDAKSIAILKNNADEKGMVVILSIKKGLISSIKLPIKINHDGGRGTSITVIIEGRNGKFYKRTKLLKTTFSAYIANKRAPSKISIETFKVKGKGFCKLRGKIGFINHTDLYTRQEDDKKNSIDNFITNMDVKINNKTIFDLAVNRFLGRSYFMYDYDYHYKDNPDSNNYNIQGQSIKFIYNLKNTTIKEKDLDIKLSVTDLLGKTTEKSKSVSMKNICE